MANLSQAITKSLLNNLPAATAKEFNLEETRVKEFLQTFLNSQLGKIGKTTRATQKGTNGKGRVTGYLLFSNENRQRVRDQNPTMKFTEIGRELGEMWKALADSEKADWVEKANNVNAENGITSSPTKTATKTTTTTTTTNVSRHSSGKWIIDGTNYVVKSEKNCAVIGKLRGSTVVVLNQNDIDDCNEHGWKVEAAPPKSRSRGAVKGGKKQVQKDDPQSEDENEDE
jgi:hypothetical protein